MRFGQRRQLVGQLAHPVAVEAQHLFGAVAGEEDRAGQQHRADRVQPELERGRDAEVPAAAAQAPQQLGILVLAGVHELSVGGDDVGGEQVVAGQADLAHQPADAAAEREPGDPRGGHEAAGDREPERLRLVIEVRPRAAALARLAVRRAGSTRTAVMAGQVDDHAAVAGGEAGQRVPAAADGDEQVLAAREVDRAHDVGDAGAADDQRRPPVVGAVPDRARLVVGRRRSGRMSWPRRPCSSSTSVASPSMWGVVASVVMSSSSLQRRNLRTRSTLPGRT